MEGLETHRINMIIKWLIFAESRLLSRHCYSLFYLMKYVPYIHYFSDEENWSNNNPISLTFQWQTHWQWRKSGLLSKSNPSTCLWLPSSLIFSKTCPILGSEIIQYSPSQHQFSLLFHHSHWHTNMSQYFHLTKKESSWPLNISLFLFFLLKFMKEQFWVTISTSTSHLSLDHLFRLWPYSKYTTVINVDKPIVISLSSCFLSQQQLA